MIREEFMVPGATTNFVAVMTDAQKRRCDSLQVIIDTLGNNIFQMPPVPKTMQGHRFAVINGINLLADMLHSLKESYLSTSNVLKGVASGRTAQNVIAEVDTSLGLLFKSLHTINLIIDVFNTNVDQLWKLSQTSPGIAKALTKWHVAAVLGTLTAGAGVIASSMNFIIVQNHFHSAANFSAAFGIVASVCGGLYTIVSGSSAEGDAWRVMSQTQGHIKRIGDATSALIALLQGLHDEWNNSKLSKIRDYRFNISSRGGMSAAASLAQILDEEAAGMIGMRRVLESKFALLPPEAPAPLPAVNDQRRTQPRYQG